MDEKLLAVFVDTVAGDLIDATEGLALAFLAAGFIVLKGADVNVFTFASMFGFILKDGMRKPANWAITAEVAFEDEGVIAGA